MNYVLCLWAVTSIFLVKVMASKPHWTKKKKLSFLAWLQIWVPMVHKMPEKFAPCQHSPIDWAGIPLNGGIKMHQTHTLRCHQTWLEDPSVRSLSQPSTSIDRRCSGRDDTGRATLRDRVWKVLGSAGRSRQGHRHQPPAWSHSPHLGHGWDPWAQDEENLGSKRQKFGWIFSLWVGNSRIFPPTNIDPCQLWVLEEYFSSIGSIQGSMLVFGASHLNLLFLFRYWRYWLKINDDHKIIWCFIHKRCHKQNRTTSQMFGPPSRVVHFERESALQQDIHCFSSKSIFRGMVPQKLLGL